ncbi:PilZ domain-containing protein [Erythrobacter sp. R86502]|uniref:PilZ domain-containing protein n=1 Tax=Erythrobacter sp. R86502 TaxID=3093846 RepID=UPI0036D28B8D
MSKPAHPSAAETLAAVGRRTAARLRLSIPARFISTDGTHDCVLIDLSSTGAQIAMAAPLPRGATGYLKVAELEVFGEAVRLISGNRGGVNGLMFDDPLPRGAVLAVRQHAETFRQREHSALLDQVRRWVMGDI